MALITTNIASCSDSFSLFPKDKSFYDVPIFSKSRSTLRSNGTSLLHSLNGGDTVSDIASARSHLARLESSSVEVLKEDAAARNFECDEEVNEGMGGLPEDEAVETSVMVEEPESPQQSSAQSDLADSFVTAHSGSVKQVPVINECTDPGTGTMPPNNFQKWMKTMARKHDSSIDRDLQDQRSDHFRPQSATSTSDDTSASSRFITTLNSASIILETESISLFPRSQPWGGVLDGETVQRMRDRMHALQELIRTEECYTGDLKSLCDHYLPMIAACVWISADIKDSISRNIRDMMDLHQSLLSDLTRVLPCITQSIDGQSLGLDLYVNEWTRTPTLSDPSAAAEVARVFDRMITALYIYEEYSSSYEIVIKALRKFVKSSLQPQGKGSEALTSTTNSWTTRNEYGKRALDIDDMLVKPIQRICKYPLLFSQIAKYTPAMDCPESNRMLNRVRQRLEGVASQVDMAPRDVQKTKSKFDKLWLLHRRLHFSDQTDVLMRQLGHTVLCGALHVVWQRSDVVEGGYMACFLFKSYLLLATISKAGRYEVKFAIALAVCQIVEADHGKGLHCRSAPFSWKLAFQGKHHFHELVLSASCQREEEAWCEKLQDLIIAESNDYLEFNSLSLDLCGVLPSGLKPLSDPSRRVGNFSRRSSLSSGLLLHQTDFIYVVINNTLAVVDASSPSDLVPTYTKLLQDGNESVPTFNLKLSERNKMVTKLSDVWTKDLLPVGTSGVDVQRRRSGTASAIKRLSMVNTLMTSVSKRSVQSLKSCDSTSSESSTVVEEYTTVPRSADIRRSSTISFQRMKSASRSRPTSPVKRSTSLSRFSFTPTVKKDSLDGLVLEEPVGSDGHGRKSLRPSFDGKLKVSVHQDRKSSLLSPTDSASSEGYSPGVSPSLTVNDGRKTQTSHHKRLYRLSRPLSGRYKDTSKITETQVERARTHRRSNSETDYALRQVRRSIYDTPLPNGRSMIIIQNQIQSPNSCILPG